MTVKPKFFIPMHFQGRPDVALRFAVTGETPQTRVIALEQPGDHIDLHLPEDETSAPDQKLKDLLKEEADELRLRLNLRQKPEVSGLPGILVSQSDT